MRLVLLHALPFDERMWEFGGPMPADAFAPRLYDLGPSIEDWAAAVVAECHDDELFVVGCSVGGSCALEVARAAPDQVRAVMLVGAKADVRPDPIACSEAVELLRIQELRLRGIATGRRRSGRMPMRRPSLPLVGWPSSRVSKI